MRFALGDIAVGSFPETRISLPRPGASSTCMRSEEHTSELQSRLHLVCRLLLEKKKKQIHLRNLRIRKLRPLVPFRVKYDQVVLPQSELQIPKPRTPPWRTIPEFLDISSALVN